MNVLQAGAIRQAYHERKKEQAAKDGKGKGKAKEADPLDDLKIRPGERMGEFNARVEQAFAGSISAAARHASKHGQTQKKRRRAKGDKDAADSDDEDGDGGGEAGREKRKANAMAAEEREKQEKKNLKAARERMADREFATVSQRKNVRDVVDAPPVFSAGKFSKAAVSDRPGKRVIEQQAHTDAAKADRERLRKAEERMLEQERERVISAYREKKEARIAQAQANR